MIQARVAGPCDARIPSGGGNAATTTVKTVEKALRVVECFFATAQELGVTEIARTMRVNTSTVQRVVNTLCKHGYLRRQLGSRRYQLGLRFLEASGLILQRMDLRPVARPHLLALRDATGETVHLMVLDGDTGVYVDVAESQQTTRVVSVVGSRDELHSSAVGKALLAFLPRQQLDAILARHGLPARTPHTITARAVFRQHLAEVRRKGYAVDDEEGEFGSRCVGAPIFDHTGAVVASVSVAAPVQRLSRRQLPRMAPLVIAAAQKISQDLGRRTGDGQKPSVDEGTGGG